MKCRACWCQRVETIREPRWQVWAAACLLAAPLKCRHCFYRFYVPIWTACAGNQPASGTMIAMPSRAGGAAMRKAA